MRVLTMICAAAIAVCATGQAQTMVDRITVHFSTPVMVGDTALPAGDCTVQVIRGSSDTVVLEVRSDSSPSDGILVLVNRVTDSNVVTDGHTRVILSHRNNSYQLDQIILPDHTGFQVVGRVSQ